jgi:FlaA1/EpsC-like NDP-sugar epimerase
LQPDRDIHITFSGLRPGEKLHEELLAHGEDLLETHHPKILISQVRAVQPNEMEEIVLGLQTQIKASLSPDAWSKVIHEIVPEYQPELGG